MAIKKELQYFNIGSSYGGSQRWMLDPWMHIGGCAALTACDTCIYLALHIGRPELYPYDVTTLSKRQYTKFAMSMKLYLQPRNSGIKDLDTYISGVKAYLEDIGVTDISLAGLPGGESYQAAKEAVRSRIDAGLPVPYLMLKHRDRKFDFFEWHWFLVNGYEEREDGFYIKVATYGRAQWLSLDELWDTGYDEKGGMVYLNFEKENYV